MKIFPIPGLKKHMKMKEKIDVDHVFSHIGELGSEQKRYFLLICVITMYHAQLMMQVSTQNFIFSAASL